MLLSRNRWWRMVLLGVAWSMAMGASAGSCAWPDWERFKVSTLSDDGRVIDASTPQQVTVSEGQAYALVFALVANDRATFDKVLTWTQNNLAQGDLTQHLPAWQWGRQKTKEGAPASWGVLDSNAASDADIWIAYALLEAGRLWHERAYTALGSALARIIVARETAELPGLGRAVLPGPVGFHPTADRWRLNPSYVPLQVMQQLAAALPEQPAWQAMLPSSLRLVTQTASRGYSPDWVVFANGKGFQPDEDTQAEGAYNAIRVYLWAGMLASNAPNRDDILHAFLPLADYIGVHAAPPERVDTRTGTAGPHDGNGGFSAAVAPFLAALGRADAAKAQVQRSRRLATETPPGYYSQVLMLFGLGYLDGLYRFDTHGALVPAWTTTCPAAR